MNDMQEFTSILSNFGFPVAVAAYLLFRFEKKIEALKDSNDQLVIVIGNLQKTLDALSKKRK